MSAKVGYADGKLVAALREQGFSDGEILETGWPASRMTAW
jgi:hypothetical protein